MWLRRIISALAVCAFAGPLVDSALATNRSVVRLPVSFQVKNTNTSQDPCPSDGASYTIKGHITAPARALSAASPPAVTMYLSGYEGGQWNWDLNFPGYDHVAEMAKLGHTSLTLDELGYGQSGIPLDGNLTCQGALADIAHQIIGDLRSGSYNLGGKPGPHFATVVLAGHDVGGQVAEIEAYSYHDITGLILMTWADQGFSSFIVERAAVAAADWCTLSPAETPVGQPTGYVHFATDDEFRTLLFYNADPRVIDAAAAQREANPCGIPRSGPIAVQFDPQGDQQVTVPLLDLYGANDTHIWSHDGEQAQQNNFGSKDKTTVFIPTAGHFLMFSRTAPIFRSVLSSWLDSRFGRGPSFDSPSGTSSRRCTTSRTAAAAARQHQRRDHRARHHKCQRPGTDH